MARSRILPRILLALLLGFALDAALANGGEEAHAESVAPTPPAAAAETMEMGADLGGHGEEGAAAPEPHGEEGAAAPEPHGEEVAHDEGPAGHADEPETLAGITYWFLVVGGEAFIETILPFLVAALWVAGLALHLARSYMLDVTGKFSLRVAADLFWLVYVLLRDAILAATFILSVFYFYPMLIAERPFPTFAPLAATLLLAVLVIKLVSDPDEDPRGYRVVTALLSAGAALYLLPVFLGVFGHGVPELAPLGPLFVTHENPALGLGVLWVSLAGAWALGLYALAYVLRGARAAPRQEEGAQ